MEYQINHYIPGGFLAIVTFPGVMMHELSHYIMCKLFNVRVHKIKFFSIKNAIAHKHFTFSNNAPIGWVSHTVPKEYYKTFFISIAPLIFNTLVAIILYIMALPFLKSHFLLIIAFLLIYLGFCCAVCAFPSTGDVEILWHGANNAIRNKHYLAVLAYPFIILVYMANFLSVLWLDWFAAGSTIIFSCFSFWSFNARILINKITN